jgi:hypothetical protein
MKYPAAFERAMAARAVREREEKDSRVQRLIRAVRCVDQDTRHIKSGCKLIKPDAWQAVMDAVKALRGR